MKASGVRNCCGIWPPIFLGVTLPVWVIEKAGSTYQHYLGRLVLQHLWGSEDFSTISCESSGVIPGQLRMETHHSVSTAWRWRGSHHCFDLHGREIRRVPLTASSKEIRQRWWDLGVEAIRCQCLTWRKTPHAVLAAWGGRSNHPWAEELCGSLS